MPSRDAKQSPLIPFLLIMTGCYAVAFLGFEATYSGLQGWYQQLSKPSFNPPDWLFGPIWTVLYGCIGVAACIVWASPSSARRSIALALFWIQLFLNGVWPFLFFAGHMLLLSFAGIVALWFAITITLVAFFRVRASAGFLFVPYIIWVTFAAFLNFAIWRMNR